MIHWLYGKGTAEALMIFNKKCFDFDLTEPERSEDLIQALWVLGPGSNSVLEYDCRAGSEVISYIYGIEYKYEKVLSTNMKNNFCCLIRLDTDENSTRRCLLRKIPVQLYDGLVFLIFRPEHHINREIVF